MRMATLKAKVSCSPIISFESYKTHWQYTHVLRQVLTPEITFYKNLKCLFTTTTTTAMNDNKE